MTTCLLIILGFCHPTKLQMTLGSINSAAVMSDAYVTQRNMALPVHYEANPVARPFVSHGKALGYVSASGEALAMAWLGNRLKSSRSGILRHIWWLPQVLSVSGHVWGTTTSVQNYHPVGIR